MTEIQKKLFEAALAARNWSHAPYSKAFIGAAVLMKDGRIFAGCNVENASFGGTVCAERVAIWKAVSEGAEKEVQDIMVVSDAKDPWPPCGLCRQVLAEFATPTTRVYTANLQGQMRSFVFGELFPESFTPDYLK